MSNKKQNYSVDAKLGRKTTKDAERRGKRRLQSRIPRYSALSVVNSLKQKGAILSCSKDF
jgi:hypothetical protein